MVFVFSIVTAPLHRLPPFGVDSEGKGGIEGIKQTMVAVVSDLEGGGECCTCVDLC